MPSERLVCARLLGLLVLSAACIASGECMLMHCNQAQSVRHGLHAALIRPLVCNPAPPTLPLLSPNKSETNLELDIKGAACDKCTCKTCWQFVTPHVAEAGDAGVEGSSLWARYHLQHLHLLLWQCPSEWQGDQDPSGARCQLAAFPCQAKVPYPVSQDLGSALKLVQGSQHDATFSLAMKGWSTTHKTAQW